MSDRSLTERDWKSFSKGGEYKDGAWLKALAAFEKSAEAGPAEQLKALDELETQADSMLKAHKGDKQLAAFMADAGKAIDKARKEAQRERERLANDDDDADDEQVSALLDPKKLLAQLNMCRRDPARRVQFGFVEAKDKQAAVLAMSPKIGGRKLFAKLQDETGVKSGAYGSVWVDGTSLMLELDKPLSGLVKKIRDPVRACGFRIAKAILWNADGSLFEQDEAPDEVPAASDAVATDARSARGRVDDGAGPAFNARLAALLPRLKAAEPVLAQRLKALLAEAGAFAREQQFERGHDRLAAADALLSDVAPGPAASTRSGADMKADAAGAFNTRLAQLIPEIKAVIGVGGPLAAALKARVDDAGKFARDKDFAHAHAALDALEAQLADQLPAAKDERFLIRDMTGQTVEAATDAARRLQRIHGQMCRTWARAAAAIAEFRASLSKLPSSEHPSYGVLVSLSKVPAPWYVEERYSAALEDVAQVLATVLDDPDGMAQAAQRLGWVASAYTSDTALVELARGLRETGVAQTLPEPAAFFEPLLAAAH